MESAVAIGYEVVGFFGSCGLFGKEGSHSTGEQTKKNRFSIFLLKITCGVYIQNLDAHICLCNLKERELNININENENFILYLLLL